MSSSYFKNFPVTSYNSFLATNITVRNKLYDVIRDNTSVYFKYTISEGDRPDIIAEKYYEDANFAWLVYFANQTLDPYFEWPLNNSDFNNFIVQKYGSMAKANETVLYFENNWTQDLSIITPGAYRALPNIQKPYWQPIFGYPDKIINYERSKIDESAETNKIIQFEFTLNTGKFEKGMIIKQGTNSCVVQHVGSGLLIVDKIVGSFSAGSIHDFDNSTTGTITNLITLSAPISALEVNYWSPVYAFDYENNLNESRKQIYLIDKNYLSQIEQEMKRLLA